MATNSLNLGLDTDTHELQLFDPEANVTHKILLNTKDYERVLNDDAFATSLLYEQINNSKNIADLDSVQDAGDSYEDTANENCNLGSASYDSQKECNKAPWLYNETKALINSVCCHLDELDHPRKRKFVFENVANDLLSQNIVKTATQSQIKWKGLVRSYKNHKDNKKRTGRGPSRFLFFEEMEEIIGTKPSTSCNHVLDSSANIENVECLEQSTTVVTADTSIQEVHEENPTETDSSTSEPKQKKRKNQVLTERYLSLRKAEYEKREIRHRERLEIEKRKVALLEKYLEKDGK